MNMIKRIGEVKNGRELLKKFATDNKFIKRMSYETFKILWEITAKDTKDILATYTIYNNVYVSSRSDTLMMEVLKSPLKGIPYNFEISFFRDDTNRQILIFIETEDNKNKGFCFAVSLDSLDFDCCFGYENGHGNRLMEVKEVRDRIRKCIFKLQKEHFSSDSADDNNVEIHQIQINDRVINNFITLVKPKELSSISIKAIS